MNNNTKIKKLRKLMRKFKVDVYIIPTSDPHQSEYLPEYWQSRKWISGFTGSAGTLVITDKESGLWTDGRYYIQASEELKNTEIKLYKMQEPNVPSYSKWIRNNFTGGTVAFNAKLFSRKEFKNMKNKFEPVGIKIKDEYDLIDEMWDGRPNIPLDKIKIHQKKYAGKNVEDKLADVREKMSEKEANYYLLSSLDGIAWLYNIRGNDVENNPVAISYAFVSQEEAFFFVDKRKLTDEVALHLKNNNVQIRDYEEIADFLNDLNSSKNIFIDPDKVNNFLYNKIPDDCFIIEDKDIVTKLKSVKNDIELSNLENCQIKDGVAMVNFLYWLENSLNEKEITEISVADKLKQFRNGQELFQDISFSTIAAYKDHAALMHYSADSESDYVLENEGMILVDSGGHYLDGTTDITRTFILGEISEKEKKDFTLTLKAHIALSQAKFLKGATGSNLDILARKPLWEEGLDYKCGTGHGVGFYLNVHEGPQSFSPVPNKVELKPGMVITVEPGVYREGEHGVRIENTLLVVEDEKTDFGQFYKFETISFFPIDLNGINKDLLTESEIEWLNNYHQKVYEKLSPHVDPGVSEWLEKVCRSI